MTATFKTFQSGTGDCIFLQLEEGEQNRTIMVDSDYGSWLMTLSEHE